jgi:hypothetical protein
VTTNVIVIKHGDGSQDIWEQRETWECAMSLYEQLLMGFLESPLDVHITQETMTPEELAAAAAAKR